MPPLRSTAGWPLTLGAALIALRAALCAAKEDRDDTFHSCTWAYTVQFFWLKHAPDLGRVSACVPHNNRLPQGVLDSLPPFAFSTHFSRGCAVLCHPPIPHYSFCSALQAVLVHQLSKGSSQNPFRKNRGRVSRVLFHPTKPFFFVAAQNHVLLYNLAKQVCVQLLRWIKTGVLKVRVGQVFCRAYMIQS